MEENVVIVGVFIVHLGFSGSESTHPPSEDHKQQEERRLNRADCETHGKPRSNLSSRPFPVIHVAIMGAHGSSWLFLRLEPISTTDKQVVSSRVSSAFSSTPTPVQVDE